MGKLNVEIKAHVSLQKLQNSLLLPSLTLLGYGGSFSVPVKTESFLTIWHKSCIFTKPREYHHNAVQVL